MPEYVFRCLEHYHRFTKEIPVSAPAPCRQSTICPDHGTAAVRVYTRPAIQTTTVPGFYNHDRARKEGPASSGAS